MVHSKCQVRNKYKIIYLLNILKIKWTLSKTYIPVDFSSETNVELSSEINVVDWWLLINIVDLIFSSVLILKSKNRNMKLDLTNYLKICKIHLYIS
jgi:hypothetical protein